MTINPETKPGNPSPRRLRALDLTKPNPEVTKTIRDACNQNPRRQDELDLRKPDRVTEKLIINALGELEIPPEEFFKETDE